MYPPCDWVNGHGPLTTYFLYYRLWRLVPTSRTKFWQNFISKFPLLHTHGRPVIPSSINRRSVHNIKHTRFSAPHQQKSIHTSTLGRVKNLLSLPTSKEHKRSDLLESNDKFYIHNTTLCPLYAPCYTSYATLLAYLPRRWREPMVERCGRTAVANRRIHGFTRKSY